MGKRYPMPLPYGWYCVLYGNELAVGQSLPLRYFGKDLVLFRTASGRAVVLDAYCPHLGAHLGYGINEEMGQGGRVEGETIICPFHAWRFDAQGKCVEIPYAKNLPPKVKDQQCLGSYPVQELNQVIWVWYHPEGKAPLWEVAEFEEAQSSEWTEPECYRWQIRTHPQEMAENGADPAHFRYVHQTATVPNWDLHYEGYQARGVQRSKMKTPQGEVEGEIHTASLGPGQNSTRFRGICETFLMGLVTPVDEEIVDVRFAFLQPKARKQGGVARALVQDIVKQLGEDKPIWEHKVYRERPILCDGDGPIAKFRKWYSQFYVQPEPPTP